MNFSICQHCPPFSCPSSHFHSCTPFSNPDFPLDPYLKEAILPTISLVRAARTESKGVSVGFRASNFEIPEPITGKVWELEDFESHPTLLVMLKQADGSYACVAETATRYTLGETEEELLRVLGLQEEQGSSLQFLRRVLLGGKKMWSWKNLLLGVIEQLREMKAGVPMDRGHAVEPDHSQM